MAVAHVAQEGGCSVITVRRHAETWGAKVEWRTVGRGRPIRLVWREDVERVAAERG